jgi:hypothetical protein
MLESTEFTTIAELAEREGIAPALIARVLRVTLFFADIIEAILDGTLRPEVTLARVLDYPRSSSGGRSPFTFVPQHGVGADEQLSHDGGNGDLRRLTRRSTAMSPAVWPWPRPRCAALRAIPPAARFSRPSASHSSPCATTTRPRKRPRRRWPRPRQAPRP